MTPDQAKDAGKQAFKAGKPYEAAVYAPQLVRPHWKVGYIEAKKEHAIWLTTPEGIEFTRVKTVKDIKARYAADAFMREAFLQLELAIIEDKRQKLKSQQKAVAL